MCTEKGKFIQEFTALFSSSESLAIFQELEEYWDKQRLQKFLDGTDSEWKLIAQLHLEDLFVEPPSMTPSKKAAFPARVLTLAMRLATCGPVPLPETDNGNKLRAAMYFPFFPSPYFVWPYFSCIVFQFLCLFHKHIVLLCGAQYWQSNFKRASFFSFYFASSILIAPPLPQNNLHIDILRPHWEQNT